MAQSSEVPAPDKAAEKAAKKAEKEAEKAAKEAEKAAEKAEKEAEKAAKKAEKEAEKAAKEAEKKGDGPGGAGDDEQGDGGGGTGGGGTRQPGESASGGGGSGGRETGGDTGSGGRASGDGTSSTMGRGSPVEDGQSPFVGERGCRQACKPSTTRAAGEDEVGDLAATGGPGEPDLVSVAAAEDEGQFEEGLFALSPATPTDLNSGAFALLTLATLVLLVGFVGGLRAALRPASDA